MLSPVSSPSVGLRRRKMKKIQTFISAEVVLCYDTSGVMLFNDAANNPCLLSKLTNDLESVGILNGASVS